MSTFAGNGTPGFADGIGTAARFNRIAGLAIDAQGTLYVSDWNNHRIRKITPDQQVTTIAGSGVAGLKNGPASEAQFNIPNGLVVDKQRNIFVTEAGNYTIRQIRPDGMVLTVAGLGTPGFADGDETQALFNGPVGIAIAPDADLIVADTLNYRIRRIDLNPGITNEPPAQPTLTMELNPALTLYGAVGKTYRIECRDDPASGAWIALENITLSTSIQKWYDPRPATPSSRIYRALEQ